MHKVWKKSAKICDLNSMNSVCISKPCMFIQSYGKGGGQRCFILFSVGDREVNGEVGVHYSHEWVSFTLEE